MSKVTPEEVLHSIAEFINSGSGTGPDGNPVNLASTATDVLRQQPDGTWRVIIDNPWGTD